jgi:Universal stress protein family
VVESGPIGPCTGEAPTDKKRLSYARARLREMILHTTGRDPGPKLNVLAEMGSLVDTILKVTDRLRVDLIVLGISPPSKVADRLGRTDTYRIMCAAHCPVLTVRERFPGPYFERLFAMNAAKPRTESKTNSNSIKSGSTKSATGQRR